MTSAAATKSLALSLSFKGDGWATRLTWLAIAALAILALLARDVADMIRIWWNVSTYNHCLLIPFIIGWLVAQRRAELDKLTPRTWLPGLILLFGAGLLWMLGEAGGIALFRHVAVIGALQGLVVTILGPSVARGLLFPIFYMVFMVPVGEELVPALQTITAKITMVLLGWSGIPAFINGIFITIPNGYFEVAEACSGVKFLIAMVAYGALVANVCFKSWWRRIAFMAVSVAVPILANGVRAFGTIYMAHLTDANAALGFDHILYGWFFFAFVIAAVMAIGWKFFDRKPSDPWLGGAIASGSAGRVGPLAGVAIALFAFALPLGWSAFAGEAGRVSISRQGIAPEVEGWTLAPPVQMGWKPHYAGADRFAMYSYMNAAGDRVDLAVALYGWQAEGREIVGYGQGAAGLDDDDWEWSANGAPVSNGLAERLVGPDRRARDTITFYIIGGKTTGSETRVKLETIKARLLGSDQSAAAITVSAEDRQRHPARPVIDAFLTAMGPPEQLAAAQFSASGAR